MLRLGRVETFATCESSTGSNSSKKGRTVSPSERSRRVGKSKGS